MPPATSDAQKILVIGIDFQNDFVLPDKSLVADGEPYGSLSVPGSRGDIERFTRFIYNHCDKLTRIFLSIDTHFVYQIFHGSMWLDGAGDTVAPYTMITPDDLNAGAYRFVGGNPSIARQCVEALAAAGKGGVFIWPYHCLTGSFGWCPETQLMQMVHFHSAARKTIGKERPVPTFKGTDIHSEMYGFLEPEFNPKGAALINKNVLDVLARTDATGGDIKFEYDQIFVGGEAGSHCLPESVRQIVKRFANYPEFTRRITILEDCTSPVPGFEQAMRDAFDEFKRNYGVQIKKSTDVTL
jgi:nicotinamidase-related amidase